MISEPAIAAASGVSQVLDKVRAYIAAAQSAATDGLTITEFAELAVGLLRVTMAAVDSVPIHGAEKKQWVLDAVGALFDATADKAIPLVAYPMWVLVRPAVRSLVLAAASGAIESILPMMRTS